VQLADNRLVAKIQTQRNFMTEATITWGAWPEDVMPRTPEFRGFGWARVAAANEAEPEG